MMIAENNSYNKEKIKKKKKKKRENKKKKMIPYEGHTMSVCVSISTESNFWNSLKFIHTATLRKD